MFFLVSASIYFSHEPWKQLKVTSSQPKIMLSTDHSKVDVKSVLVLPNHRSFSQKCVLRLLKPEIMGWNSSAAMEAVNMKVTLPIWGNSGTPWHLQLKGFVDSLGGGPRALETENTWCWFQPKKCRGKTNSKYRVGEKTTKHEHQHCYLTSLNSTKTYKNNPALKNTNRKHLGDVQLLVVSSWKICLSNYGIELVPNFGRKQS